MVEGSNMNNNKLQDNLNRLDAILNCIDTPVDKNQTKAVQNMSSFFLK